MKIKAYSSLLLWLLILPVCSFKAGGFQVNLLSQKHIGMGHAGAGLYLDPATMVLNPATLAMRGKSSFSFGTSPIFARVSYLENAPGTYTASNSPVVSTPFSAYAAFQIKKSWAVGMAVYTPFGSTVRYEDDWKGQFALREIALRTIFFQPTFSYKFDIAPDYYQYICVGIAPVYASGSVSLKRAVPAQYPDGSYGSAHLSGQGSGWGFNGGIYARFNKAWSVGLSYRSSVGFKAENGTATFEVPGSLSSFFPNTTFSANLALPWTLTAAAGYRRSNKLIYALDINYVGWNVYDTLAFDFVDNTDNLEDLASPRNYKNSFIFRAGANYTLNPKLALRGGAYFDMTPVPDGYTTPESPDAHKVGIAAGLTWKPLKGLLEVDASFLFVEGLKRTDTNLETQLGGTWKARAFIPGFGLVLNLPQKKKE